MTGDGGEWIEVMPYPEDEPEPGNMAPVVSHAMGTKETFEFAVVNASKPGDPKRRAVRMFWRAPNRKSREILENHLEARGLYVSSDYRPNFEDYDLEVELEAGRDYALPFLDLPAREDWWRANPPDIAAKLWGAVSSGGALRVAFKNDPGAKTHIFNKARKLERTSGSVWKPILTSFGDAVFPSADGKKREERLEDTHEMEKRREKAEFLRARAGQGTLSADVRVYGTPEEMEAIRSSLPFADNTFEPRRHRPLNTPERDERGDERKWRMNPDRQWWKKQLKKLVAVTPLLFLAPLAYLNIWNPLELLDTTTIHSAFLFLGVLLSAFLGLAPAPRLERLSKWKRLILALIPLAALALASCFSFWSLTAAASASIHSAILFAALAVSAVIWFGWRLKKPIVLSLNELAFLASLPRKIKGLPIRVAPEAPPTTREGEHLDERLPESELGGEGLER